MPVEVGGECDLAELRYVVESNDENTTGEPAARSYLPSEDFGSRDAPGLPDSKHRRFLHPKPESGSDCTSNWQIPTAYINLSPRSPISQVSTTCMLDATMASLSTREPVGAKWARRIWEILRPVGLG